MSACRSCGAPVVWAVTEAGKRIPLDAVVGRERAGQSVVVPLVVDDGNLAVVGMDESGAPVVAVQADGTHRTHFASCPYAAQHRKPRR